MKEFSSAHVAPVWYEESGPEDDVVVSSRVRLSRNLSGLIYPAHLPDAGLDEARTKIDAALREAAGQENILRYDFEDLGETLGSLLDEEGRAGPARDIRKMSIFLLPDGKVSVEANARDHLRITALRGGLRLRDAWTDADRLDTLLENALDYAVSLELGYLSSELDNLGPALRASVLLHLPGISLSSRVEKIEKIVTDSGHSLRPFSAEENVPGDLFVLSGGSEIGITEGEILEKLEVLSVTLLNYEREMRSFLFDKKGDFLEDQMCRALGILERAKFLHYEEAVKLLSLVRMGASMECASPIDRSLVTSLMFRTRPAHVRTRIGGGPEAEREERENRERAAMIRGELKKSSRDEEGDRV